MKRGKKPGPEKEAFKIYLPIELALELKLRLTNPSRAKVRYGSVSLLCEMLIRRHLEETSTFDLPVESIEKLPRTIS